MIYDGVVANLLSIEMEEIHQALIKQFGKRKAKAADLNWGAAKAGYDFAEKNLAKTDPFRVERMNATAGKIIIDGNSAAALGCVFGGVTVVTWYPITPSSSLVESMMGYLKRFRIDRETGKATYAHLPDFPREPHRAISFPPHCSRTATPGIPCSSRAHPKSASAWPWTRLISPNISRLQCSS